MACREEKIRIITRPITKAHVVQKVAISLIWNHIWQTVQVLLCARVVAQVIYKPILSIIIKEKNINMMMKVTGLYAWIATKSVCPGNIMSSVANLGYVMNVALQA